MHGSVFHAFFIHHSMIENVFEYNQHFVAMMNVINKAKINPPKNGHKHHIIPKCWYKMNGLDIDNSEENLVLLSYEDHILVHKLAILCAKNEMKIKLKCALQILSRGDPQYVLKGENNPMFGKHSWNYGKHHSLETKEKISKALIGNTPGNKGKPMKEETKNKLSISRKGNKMSEETKLKISQSMKNRESPNKGKKLSEETKSKMRGKTPWNKGISWRRKKNR